MLKSTDDEYVAILQMINTFTDYEYLNIYPSPEENLLVIKGKQNDRRLIEGDIIRVRGRYKDVEEVNVDSNSIIVPSIDVFSSNPAASNFEEPEEIYTFEEVERVAKILFGNNIKMSSPDYGELMEKYGRSALYSRHYEINLDEVTNKNFSSFEIYTNTPLILDGTYDFFGDQYKEFNIAPDFNHFIIIFYDYNIKKAYLEYYDKEYNKIWSKEFNDVDSLSYDASISDFYLIANNDLYIFDTSTGEEKVNPTFVGQKIKVNMVEDGCLLIGTSSKDNVMKVSKDGEIIWKTSLNLDIVGCNSIQFIDGNIVIDVEERVEENYNDGIAVLDANGNILLETYKK